MLAPREERPTYEFWSNSGIFFSSRKLHPLSNLSNCARAKVKGHRELKIEVKTFEENGAHHFSLIGHHLESVGRTEPVFELNLALTEKRPTNECQSDSGIFFIELSY